MNHKTLLCNSTDSTHNQLSTLKSTFVIYQHQWSFMTDHLIWLWNLKKYLYHPPISLTLLVAWTLQLKHSMLWQMLKRSVHMSATFSHLEGCAVIKQKHSSRNNTILMASSPSMQLLSWELLDYIILLHCMMPCFKQNFFFRKQTKWTGFNIYPTDWALMFKTKFASGKSNETWQVNLVSCAHRKMWRYKR